MEPVRENPPPYTPYPGAPPPPGFVDPLNQVHTYPPPPPGQTVVTVRQVQAPPIVMMGGCPACRVGVISDHVSCMGIMCCILLFPIGIICLLTCREKRCTSCGASFN